MFLAIVRRQAYVTNAMTRQRYWICDQFFSGAQQLRGSFEKTFSNPQQATTDRFVWDFWHVPGKYRHLRADPKNVFSSKKFQEFVARLSDWGLSNLGCMQLSPIWLSAYVDGCFQQLHSDFPHGPWAFVYGLGPKSTYYSGGRTLVAKDALVNFWDSAGSGNSFHFEDYFEAIDTKFNRLIVFDPRLPHAVDEVRGALDLMQARLVLHGWFLPPAPVALGKVLPQTLRTQTQSFLKLGQDVFSSLPKLHGLLSFELRLGLQGKVEGVGVLSNTLINRDDPEDDLSDSIEKLKKYLKTMNFGKADRATRIILPLNFY